VYHVQGSGRDSLDLAHPGRVFIITAVLVLVIDQVAKWAVRASIPFNRSIPLWRNVFHLTLVRNQGAAFGLFQGGRPVFILTTALVLFVIAAYWRRVRPTQWPVVIALALVTAGAIGNMIDRSVMGYVTDFFDFNLIDFPVFNVADMAVVTGVGVLMAWILFGPEQAQGSVQSADGSGDEAPGDETAVAQVSGDEREAERSSGSGAASGESASPHRAETPGESDRVASREAVR